MLEGASAYIVNAPLKFAEILARFLMAGAADRIIWGTGCSALHPRPLIEAFWNFELPEAMIEGYGLPPLTRELKRAILGGNIARILELDVAGRDRRLGRAVERRDPSMNEAIIRAELNEILDPCSVVAGAPAGIEELGLVRFLSVEETPGGVSIELRIGVTEPGCMMGASFAIKARERLETLAGVLSVEVGLDHEADWSPADIDPAYSARLAGVRAARRQGVKTSFV